MKKANYTFLALLVLAITIVACKKEEPVTDPGDSENIAAYDDSPYNLVYGSTMSNPTIPTDNPLTKTKVALGRALFYERSLSGDGTMACAGCHNLSLGFSDSAQFSTGIAGMQGGRQAMPIFNMAWHSNQFFWDGRANLLRDQSILPIQDPLEMNETLENVVSKLTARVEYRSMFNSAFGSQEITSVKISHALEAFMHSIVSDDSKYDKYLRGEVTLTASEERGRVLYFAEYNPAFPNLSGADCQHCHGGSNFENDQYMNNGLDTDANMTDEGRKNATEDPMDKGKFKVSSLRNIAVTAPYMHDGRFKTLEEVVDHYNNGIQSSSTLDPALENTQATGLMLDAQDKTDLVNFLKTLTDDTFLNNPDYKKPN
jgi:cytochrome c peroxidase